MQVLQELMIKQRHVAGITQLVAAAHELNPVLPELGLRRTVQILLHLAKDLAWFVGAPGTWLLQVLRLLVFTVLMLPGFLPVTWHYLRSPAVRKNLKYGPSMRHQLDVYLPSTGTGAAAVVQPAPSDGFPVVLFVSGGAWIIGYKLWGWMMGQVFALNGVLCLCCDYRNFPQAEVPGMVEDVGRALYAASRLEHAHLPTTRPFVRPRRR